MLKNPTPLFQGFLHATGVVIYLILLSCFFSYVTPLFNNVPDIEFLAPIMMLLLFITSAVISGTLVLARPGMLFWDKKYKEAFVLLSATVGSMVFYFILFLTIYFIFSFALW